VKCTVVGIPDSTPGITENEIPMVLVGMPAIQPFMPDKSLGNYTHDLRVEVPYTYSLGAEALLIEEYKVPSSNTRTNR
jgi:hypothetical protein